MVARVLQNQLKRKKMREGHSKILWQTWDMYGRPTSCGFDWHKFTHINCINTIDFLLQVLNQNWPEGASKEDCLNIVKSWLKPTKSVSKNLEKDRYNNNLSVCCKPSLWRVQMQLHHLSSKGISDRVLQATDMLQKLGLMCLILTRSDLTVLLGIGCWQSHHLSRTASPHNLYF